MYDVMEGIRVIECAEHTFVPVAATTLADWGADVVKIERTAGGGDSARNMAILQQAGQKRNGYFEVTNRGKLAGAPGFDHPSAWCRSGSAFAQDPRDGNPPRGSPAPWAISPGAPPWRAPLPRRSFAASAPGGARWWIIRLLPEPLWLLNQVFTKSGENHSGRFRE